MALPRFIEIDGRESFCDEGDDRQLDRRPAHRAARYGIRVSPKWLARV